MKNDKTLNLTKEVKYPYTKNCKMSTKLKIINKMEVCSTFMDLKIDFDKFSKSDL